MAGKVGRPGKYADPNLCPECHVPKGEGVWPCPACGLDKIEFLYRQLNNIVQDDWAWWLGAVARVAGHEDLTDAEVGALVRRIYGGSFVAAAEGWVSTPYWTKKNT
jgi:rubredoxin